MATPRCCKARSRSVLPVPVRPPDQRRGQGQLELVLNPAAIALVATDQQRWRQIDLTRPARPCWRIACHLSSNKTLSGLAVVPALEQGWTSFGPSDQSQMDGRQPPLLLVAGADLSPFVIGEQRHIDGPRPMSAGEFRWAANIDLADPAAGVVPRREVNGRSPMPDIVGQRRARSGPVATHALRLNTRYQPLPDQLLERFVDRHSRQRRSLDQDRRGTDRSISRGWVIRSWHLSPLRCDWAPGWILQASSPSPGTGPAICWASTSSGWFRGGFGVDYRPAAESAG